MGKPTAAIMEPKRRNRRVSSHNSKEQKERGREGEQRSGKVKKETKEDTHGDGERDHPLRSKKIMSSSIN